MISSPNETVAFGQSQIAGLGVDLIDDQMLFDQSITFFSGALVRLMRKEDGAINDGSEDFYLILEGLEDF